MATQKPASTVNRALWVIALSLAVIATCLVVLVIRQHTPATKEEAVATILPVEPKTEQLFEKPSPSIARKSTPHPQSPPESPPAPPEPKLSPVPASSDTAPQLMPVMARESFSSTGLAPLTFLGSNDFTGITGRVYMKDTPAPETPIQMDAVCGRLHKTPITTHRYVVSTNGGLANVFVYIKSGLAHKKFPVPDEPAVLSQIGCEFQPLVLGLMTRQRLLITNSDTVFHNVDARPRAQGNTAFNLSEASGAFLSRQFTSEEIPLRIKCDVHPWMEAYVCVVNHPFFAVTDLNGNYAIKNMPPGDYDLEFIHLQTGGSVRFPAEKISVKKGEVTTLDYEFPLFGK